MCPCYHNEKWHKTFSVDLWILCTSLFWTELATLLVVYGDKMWIQNRDQQTAKFHGQRSYNLVSGALLNKLWNIHYPLSIKTSAIFLIFGSNSYNSILAFTSKQFWIFRYTGVIFMGVYIQNRYLTRIT